MELSTIITRAQQQRNATATQLDSSDFFVRRPKEYEGTLRVLTTRNHRRIIRARNLLNRLRIRVTLHLERATISRRSWRTTVPRKFSNFLWVSANFAFPCYLSLTAEYPATYLHLIE